MWGKVTMVEQENEQGRRREVANFEPGSRKKGLLRCCLRHHLEKLSGPHAHLEKSFRAKGRQV